VRVFFPASAWIGGLGPPQVGQQSGDLASVVSPGDTQPDDDDQADSDPGDSGDADLAVALVWDRPAEWRFIRPDSKYFNSFIHSKAKPPP
jgi:hypothetical protein